MSVTAGQLRAFAERLRQKAMRSAESADSREWAWERSAAHRMEQAAEEIEALRSALDDVLDRTTAEGMVSE